MFQFSVFSNNKLNPNGPLVFFYILTTLPVALFCRTWDYFTQNNNNNNTYCKIIYSFSIFLKLIYFRRFYKFLLIYSPIFFAIMSTMIQPNPIQYGPFFLRPYLPGLTTVQSVKTWPYAFLLTHTLSTHNKYKKQEERTQTLRKLLFGPARMVLIQTRHS